MALSHVPEYSADSPAPRARADAAHNVQVGNTGSLRAGRRYQSAIGDPSTASTSTTIETALTPVNPIPRT